MNRTFFILLLGLIIGTGAHLAYYRLHEPNADSLDSQLAWMKTELKLNDAQFARIKELHQNSSPRLHALADQVALLQTEFAAFEEMRRTSDRVDFLEFARFVEARRKICEKFLIMHCIVEIADFFVFHSLVKNHLGQGGRLCQRAIPRATITAIKTATFRAWIGKRGIDHAVMWHARNQFVDADSGTAPVFSQEALIRSVVQIKQPAQIRFVVCQRQKY